VFGSGQHVQCSPSGFLLQFLLVSLNDLTPCSGSGKTTLLNVLAHREAGASVQKSIHLNGAPIDLEDFRKLSSFVEQEDALVGSLTVHETLDFAARLSLPR